MHLSVTLVLIVVTTIISFIGFYNDRLFEAFIFYPPAITDDKQYYRFFTCGFIHANFMHFLFNMYALNTFGDYVESEFADVFGKYGAFLYGLMYISSLYFCLLPTYAKHKHNAQYSSLGASGAVSAVVFCFIFLEPVRKLGIIFLPFMLPGFLFGFLYLVISSLLDRSQVGRINHSAHIWGSLYGISFLVVFGSFLSRYNLFNSFIRQVEGYISSF